MKTGKIKQIAALDKVLTICNTYGASYNPGNESLKTTALGALLKLAQDKAVAVNVTQSAYALAVNNRRQMFEGLPKLGTQLVRMVLASKTTADDREEAKRIKRQLSSQSRVKDRNAIPGDAGVNAEVQATRSASKLDRDSLMNTFERLIQLVQGIAAYKPNEPEFKIDALKAKLAALQAANKAAIAAGVNYSNARIALHKTVHGADGVIDCTRGAQNYIRAKFGFGSLESKQTRETMNF